MERLTKTFEENGKLFACLPECEHRCVYGWNEYNSGCRCSKFTKILKRLAAIEDILGDGYDLDRLRELVEADRDGRCVIYLKGFPVASTYLQEGGLYIRETSGVIGHEEYKAALKGEQDG